MDGNVANYDHEDVKIQSQSRAADIQNSNTAKDIYKKLKDVKFDSRDSNYSNTWAGNDQINLFIIKALQGSNSDILAYYIGPTNFAFDSEEGIKDIAKHICRREGIPNNFYDHEELLKKPFIIVSNTVTVLGKNSTDVNQQGGLHWISWVLLPKKYRSLSGKQINADKYKVYFFDSLGETSFPESLRKFLTEGGEISEKIDTGEQQIKLIPFCAKEEIDFDSLQGLTGQQNNGSDCGWWATYYALMTVYTGGIEFLEKLKGKKLSAKSLRNIMSLEQSNKQQTLDDEILTSIKDIQSNVASINLENVIDSDDEREKNAELFSAIRKGNLQNVQRLLKEGVKSTIVDKNNKDNTPLHYAVEKEKKEIVQEFLLPHHGTDIDAKNSEGETPLDIAVRKGNDELIQLLLNTNSKVNLKNKIDETSADIAKNLNKPDMNILKANIQTSQHTRQKMEKNRMKKTQSLMKTNKNSQRTKHETKKRPGTRGYGESYEIDLLMLAKIKGESDTDEFYLESNLEGIGAFDDIVFKYQKNEKSTIILLQAKHVESIGKNKITIEKFKNPNKGNKFNLFKYFCDYLISRDQFNSVSTDPVFKGDFKDLDIKFVIYTNCILDENFDQDRISDIGDSGILFTADENNKGKALKLRSNGENVDITATLENFSGERKINLLAEALVSCFIDKNEGKKKIEKLNYNNMMGNPRFKKYHVFLSDTLIKVKDIKKDNNDVQYREGAIIFEFLEKANEDSTNEKFRKEFLYEYAKTRSSFEIDKNIKDEPIEKLAKLLKESKKLPENIIKKLTGTVITLDDDTGKLIFSKPKKLKNKVFKDFLKELEMKVGDLTEYQFDFPHELVLNELKTQIGEKPIKLHIEFGNIDPDLKKQECLNKKPIELLQQDEPKKLVNYPAKSKKKSIAETLVSYLIDKNEETTKLEKLNYNNIMSNTMLSKYHVFLSNTIIEVKKDIKEDEKNVQYRDGAIIFDFLEKVNENSAKEKFRKEFIYNYAKARGNLEFDKNIKDISIEKLAELLKDANKKLPGNIVKKLIGTVIILDDDTGKLIFSNPKKLTNKAVKFFLKDLEERVGDLRDFKLAFPYEHVVNELKARLEEKPLKLHVEFGNIDPNLIKPQHLIEKLIDLLQQDKSAKVVKIDGNLNFGDIKNIGKLVGNLFTFNEKTQMFRLTEKENLDNKIKSFFIELKTTAQKHELNIEDYIFDIKIKNFPRDSLTIIDNEDKTNVAEFLNNLEIFTGQASVLELRKIVEAKIKNFYKLTHDEARINFSQMREKIEHFWRFGGYYLEKNDDLFNNIVKKHISFRVRDPVTSFTGRTDELAKLHEAIKRNPESVTVISQMTSISGMGGIGKTELSKKYIQMFHENYDSNIIWIDAEDLTESFKELAKQLDIHDEDEKNIENVIKSVYEFFRKRKSLFIFDNVEEIKDIINYLPLRCLSPGANKPYILITSQNREWEKGIKVIELDTLKLDDAMTLVKKGLNITDDTQDEGVKRLVLKLQYFPLALQQAIAYIYDERIGGEFEISDYLNEYEKEVKNVLKSELFIGIDNDYAKTTFTTWKIAIQKISSSEEYGVLAVQILNTVAYFAPERISRDIFLDMAENDDAKLKKAVRLLVKYCIMNGEQNQSLLNIHRLVQEVTRIELKEQKENVNVLRKALELVRKHVEDEKNLDNEFISHAMYAWDYARENRELVKDFNSLPNLVIVKLTNNLRYQEAELFGEKALTALKDTLGEEHECVKRMEERLSVVYYALGKNAKALEIYADLENKFYNLLKFYMNGPNSCMTSSYVNKMYENERKHHKKLKTILLLQKTDGIKEHNIVRTLVSQNEYVAYLNGELENRELYCPDFDSILNSKQSIAAALGMQGKLEEAYQINLEVYEGRKRLLGKIHPRTLTAYCNIASVLWKQNKYNEALKIAVEVEVEYDKSYPQHSDTLDLKKLIANILQDQNKNKEALKKFEEVYERRMEVSGKNHKDTYILIHIAALLPLFGKYDEALKKLEQATCQGGNPNVVLYIIQNFISAIQSQRQRYRQEVENLGNDLNGLFHRVALDGDEEKVNYLINKGANICSRVKGTRSTALHLAAQNGHLKIVEKLLQSVNDINIQDNSGNTALHDAANNNRVGVVERLLKSEKIKINSQNENRETALHCAIKMINIGVVEKLMENEKIDINIKDKNGLTALQFPVKVLYNEDTKAKQLYTFCINTQYMHSIHKQEPILGLQVKYFNFVEMIGRLLKKRILDINFKDNNGITVLHFAAQVNHIEVVKKLLQSKADVNSQDNENRTPLYFATRMGNDEVVTLLLENRANPHLRQWNGVSPLHQAAHRNDLNIVQTLINFHANVNCYDEEYWTPLDFAAQEGHVEIVRLLLKNRADTSLTTLKIAVQCKHLDVIGTLFDYCN